MLQLNSRAISILVVLLAMPVAVFLGMEAAQERVSIVYAGVVVFVLCVLLFGIPQYLWAIAIASFFMPKAIPGFPLPLSPQEAMLMLLIGRFFVDEVIFKKRWFQAGPSPDKYFLFGLLLVLAYHGFKDRLGMRVLGSEVWGGRGYFAMVIGILAYFVAVSSKVQANVFLKLPHFVLLIALPDLLGNLVTTLFPATTRILWWYGNPDLEASMTFESEFGRRWGFLGNFGYLVLIASLATARIQDWFAKGKLWNLFGVLLGVTLCFASGYRSSVGNAFIICTVVAWRDLGKASISIAAPVVLTIGFIVFLQENMGLPPAIQRGLTFLPANWDPGVKADAENSVDFRTKVWREWSEKYFPKNPVLGRGFALHWEDMIATLPYTTNQRVIGAPTYSRDEAFAVSGNLHHGFYSVVDRFGIVGAICFTLWSLSYAARIVRYLKQSRSEPLNPALQWLAIYLLVFLIGFPLGALRCENFLPQHMFFLAMFYTVQRAFEEEKARESVAPASSQAAAPAFPRPRANPFPA